MNLSTVDKCIPFSHDFKLPFYSFLIKSAYDTGTWAEPGITLQAQTLRRGAGHILAGLGIWRYTH